MYFFSFIYNMLKCQKEEKVFCKTQKYELQLLPAACCFHKNELELFLEDWPRRPPPSPDASGLPPFRHCHLFFYFFSIFCIQHISVSLPATYTHSRQHIPFGFCLLPELYAFIIFSFRSVLILSQVATLSSGVSRPYQHATSHSYPSTGQSLAFRLFRPHPHHISNIFSSQSNLSLSSAITLSSGTRRPSSYP